MQEDINTLRTQLAEARRQAQQAALERDSALKKLKEYEDKAIKAEKASRMKSLFLANMSHEIRTPLNAIEGFSRIIAETDSPEDRMKFMEIVESNNNRLLSLINEILDLSRVEAGEVTVKKSMTDLQDMCKNIKQIFKFRCPERVKLRIECEEDNIMLNTDQNRITQVLCNLISNALKHTTKGSISYGYKLADDKKDITFHVTDTGSGIAPEHLDSIFETYVSQDAENSNNGYGLGLPLSKIIVEKLGGKLTVESKLGEGSKFSFVLPFDGVITKEKIRKPEITLTRTIKTTPAENVNNLKLILVAEDEEFNYELVKNVLVNRYRLVRAKTGIEAVTLNEEERPDLILMDIRMPEMNGIDATRIIKEINPNLPIIALSAFALEDSINEARNAGCDEFIAKPFKVEHLQETIARLLRNKK